MGRQEKYLKSISEGLTPLVDEPIEAVGMLSRPGGFSSVLLSSVSPGAGAVKNSDAKQRAGGLPQNVLVAVTPTQLRFFDYRPKATKVKVKKEVASWPRDSFTAATEKLKTARRLTLTFADGETVELESQMANKDISKDPNYPVFAALGAIAA